MGVVAKAKGKEACVDAFRQHIAEVTAGQREASAGGAGDACSGRRSHDSRSPRR